MTAEEAIDNLPPLMDTIRAKAADVDSAITRVHGQWNGLRRVGGQRADHAAALLSDVRIEMQRFARFLNNACEQIRAIEADPFGAGHKQGV